MAEEPACVAGEHVYGNERPILLLVHQADGLWQAMCGRSDHNDEGDDCVVVDLSLIFSRRPDLAQLASLPPAHFAEWRDGVWQVNPFEEDGASPGAKDAPHCA